MACGRLRTAHRRLRMAQLVHVRGCHSQCNCESSTGLLSCPLLCNDRCHRAEALGDSTVAVLGHASCCSRQVAMVLIVQTPFEISQLQFFDKVVDMPFFFRTTRTVASTVLPTSTAPTTLVPIEVRCCSPSARSPTSLSWRRGKSLWSGRFRRR